MHDACKNKDGEADRTHARAMTVEDMDRLVAYMQQQCPEDREPNALGLIAGVLMFNAFATTGFTLWTRSVIYIGIVKFPADLHTHPSNCETVRLQAKHFDFSPDPRPGRSPASGKYIKVSLKNRKNWQRKMKKGEHGLNGESPISQAYTLF